MSQTDALVKLGNGSGVNNIDGVWDTQLYVRTIMDKKISMDVVYIVFRFDFDNGWRSGPPQFVLPHALCNHMHCVTTSVFGHSYQPETAGHHW